MCFCLEIGFVVYVCVWSVVYVCVCVFTAIALSLQEAEKKSKSQPASSLYPSMSNVGSTSTSAVKNREPRKVMCRLVTVAQHLRVVSYSRGDNNNNDNNNNNNNNNYYSHYLLIISSSLRLCASGPNK